MQILSRRREDLVIGSLMVWAQQQAVASSAGLMTLGIEGGFVCGACGD